MNCCAFKRSFQVKTTGLLFLFLTGFFTFSQAQVRVMTGVVSASDTRETLPEATILIKGIISGAVTDLDENYSNSIKTDKAVLVFSYVGYNTKELELGNTNILNVALDPKKTTLDEIMVIGYGSVRNSNLSGSVGSVKLEDITRITALNPVLSLQGNFTGVQGTSISGTPGENPAVRILGVGTFGNSKVGTMYINGEKLKAFDYNPWSVGDPNLGVSGLKYADVTPDVVNELAFGFIQSCGGAMWATEPWGGYQSLTANHFGGWLDEVRVYQCPLSEQKLQPCTNSSFFA